MWYYHKEMRSVTRRSPTYRGVEQLVARRAHNPEVGGSSPPSATKQDISSEVSFFRALTIVGASF